MLVAFSPVALLFGVTSFDWLYAALGAVGRRAARRATVAARAPREPSPSPWRRSSRGR